MSTLSERFKWQQTEIREKRGVSQQQGVRNQSSATSTQQQQKRVSQPRATSTVQVLNSIITITGTIYTRLWSWSQRKLLGFGLNLGMLRTHFPFNIHIFDLCKMTWCTLASPKQNFRQLQSSGKELLHNEAHSTSHITVLIFQWVTPLLPKWICVHCVKEH